MRTPVLRHLEVMKRTDDTGRIIGWGVMMQGGRFVCPLPDGYDGGKVELACSDSRILVRQAGLPMLVCDPYTGSTRSM